MFWNSTKKYPTIKQGFLVPRDGGDMREAELHCYDNGVYVVKAYSDNYEAHFAKHYEFNVSSYSWPRFIVTKVA